MVLFYSGSQLDDIHRRAEQSARASARTSKAPAKTDKANTNHTSVQLKYLIPKLLLCNNIPADGVGVSAAAAAAASSSGGGGAGSQAAGQS